MTELSITPGGHLPSELLVRLLDDELTGGETAAVEIHLAACGVCRERYAELRHVSSSFDSFLSSAHPVHSPWERQQLAHKLDHAENRTQKVKTHAAWKKLACGMAAAAALVFGVLLLPYRKSINSSATQSGSASSLASSAFEVDGETFVALPYSNPDLPLTAPHIVQMQVPISSLADAGIYVEPVGSSVSAPDRAVLANVLLGLDGQPLGVHVLTSD